MDHLSSSSASKDCCINGLLLGVEDTGYVTTELCLTNPLFFFVILFLLLLIVLHQLCLLHQVGAHKWHLNFTNISYMLSLALMFSDKGFFTWMRGQGCQSILLFKFRHLLCQGSLVNLDVPNWLSVHRKLWLIHVV